MRFFHSFGCSETQCTHAQQSIFYYLSTLDVPLVRNTSTASDKRKGGDWEHATSRGYTSLHSECVVTRAKTHKKHFSNEGTPKTSLAPTLFDYSNWPGTFNQIHMALLFWKQE